MIVAGIYVPETAARGEAALLGYLENLARLEYGDDEVYYASDANGGLILTYGDIRRYLESLRLCPMTSSNS